MVSEHGPEMGWVEYELGAHVLAVGKAPGMNASADGPSCGLETDDFEKTVAELREAGVKITMEPIETPVCHMAIINDPAGNAIIIHKRKPGHH